MTSRQYLWGGLGCFLLAVIVAVTWLATKPEPRQPEPPKVAAVPARRIEPRPSAPPAPPPRVSTTHAVDPRAIDPEIQRLADDLANKKESPARDVEIVDEFVSLYRRAFQANPIGDNADVTATLTGANPRKGVLFPANSPMIVRGQLVDRWGTPYWFHPSSSTKMEIRSAGPDKQLFTADDIVMNPGPESFGPRMAGTQ